jgi:hypothetical protein
MEKLGIPGAASDGEDGNDDPDDDYLPPPSKRNHHAKGAFPMACRSKKKRQASRRNIKGVNDARRQSAADPVHQAQASLWAFSTLVSGGRYQQNSLFAHFLGVPVPSNGAFYTAQRGIAREIIELARLSVQRHCAFMSQGTAIAFDGAWAHARRSRQIVGCFITQGDNPKIIDYECHGWYNGEGRGRGERGIASFGGDRFSEVRFAKTG